MLLCTGGRVKYVLNGPLCSLNGCTLQHQRHRSHPRSHRRPAAPSLPKPPTLPKLEDLPKPAAPSSSGLPEPKQAAKQAVSAVKEAVPEAPQQAAKDATAALKSAAPEGPKQAAQDAASAAKEALPEAPKTNPFQSFFQGELCPASGALCQKE